MPYRRPILLLLAAVALACDKIDRIVEGPFVPDARFVIQLETGVLSLPRGGEHTLSVTIKRVGLTTGDVTVKVEGAPQTVTTEIAGAATTGSETTAQLTLRAAAGTSVGTYMLTVRAQGDPPYRDGTTSLMLNVVEPAEYSLAVSRMAFTILSGGIAPARIDITRSNFPSPITLSVEGVPGITAAFDANPVAGGSVGMTLSVAAGVEPGTYAPALRAVADGLDDRRVPLAVTVTGDAMQIIADPVLSVGQASAITRDIIVNRAGNVGTVTVSTDNLPTGVAASFAPGASSTNRWTMTLDAGPTTPVGEHSVTITARSDGFPDATAEFLLNVTSAGVAISLTPQSVTVFPAGPAATSALAITRTNFDGTVIITAEGAPAAVTVAAQPASVTGNSSLVSVTAGAGALPGQYDVTIRATPAGFPQSASQVAALTVIVREAAGEGNVLLDWSACAEPAWIASQDGTGPWTQVVPAAGIARFAVSSARGGFAYAERGYTVVVRYMSRSELTAGAIDMCPPPAGKKTIEGMGPASAGEMFSYSIGGGTGTSTGPDRNFIITGVHDGLHDLVGFTPQRVRGVIRRDQDIPDGGSLGLVDFNGPESFAMIRPTLLISNAFTDGATHSMSYLTTPACVVNPLYATGPSTMFGVPAELQRPTDFHMVTVTSTNYSARRMRSVSLVTHALTNRNISLPPFTSVPTVTALGGSYERLRLFVGTTNAVYNRSFVLQYDNGAKFMTVSATRDYVGPVLAVTLEMPDFSGVSGWPNSFAVPAGVGGNWTLALDGVNLNAPLCTEDRVAIVARHWGSF